MRFVVDESTGGAVADLLRSHGYDVLEVAAVMPQAGDLDILEWAAREGRVVITNDKDFGELVYRLHRSHQGVILLRLRDESAASRVRVVESVLERYSDRLSGHFIVASEGGVRIRRAL